MVFRKHLTIFVSFLIDGFNSYGRLRLEFVTHSANVQCAFDETEEALLELENMIETQGLREKELEHRFQLALYRKKREDELDDLKGMDESLKHWA